MANKSIRAVLFVAIALLIASLIWGFVENESKNLYKVQLNTEKLKYESLVSEKLSDEKERDKALRTVSESEQRSKQLSAEIESLTKKLQENSSSLRNAWNKNSSSKKRYAELMKSLGSLQDELSALTNERDNLRNQAAQIADDLIKLKIQNENLEEELRVARVSRFDKPRIEASRGSSNKLVSKASRVQRLKATLSVSATAEDLKFVVIDPKGVTLTENDGTVSSRILASTSGSKQVEMTFSPKKRLQSGMYQIEVVSGAIHIASLQVSLR